MIYLLAVDLLVTGCLLVVLVASWRRWHRRCRLTWAGFQVTTAATFALLASIALRIEEVAEAEWEQPPRNGYLFAVLTRVGLLLLMAGLACRRRGAA